MTTSVGDSAGHQCCGPRAVSSRSWIPRINDCCVFAFILESVISFYRARSPPPPANRSRRRRGFTGAPPINVATFRYLDVSTFRRFDISTPLAIEPQVGRIR